MKNAVLDLSKFQAKGLETCFHDRHITPQIYTGLNGSNWRLKDYESRGGYQALRKILTANAEGTPGMTPDQVVRAIIASGLPYDQIIREFDRWTHVSIPNTPEAKPRRQALIIDRTGTRAFA